MKINVRNAFTSRFAINHMLSLPDFREKQILFVSAGDIDVDKIKIANDNICLCKNGKIENQISCHKVFCVFIIGECSLTSVMIRNCKRYGVSVFLCNRNFLAYARIISTAEGNYLLREKQYSWNETSELEMAKKLVLNKIENQVELLLEQKMTKSPASLKDIKLKAAEAKKGKDLLGLEGSASKFFFQEYFSEMGWKRRLPRAKTDVSNVLLDIGYTMLFNFIDGMAGIYGFDSYKGFYHRLFFQRKSLVCDLMEPFRCIIDKAIVKAYHLGQIDEDDFKERAGKRELGWNRQEKYLALFAQAILDHREEIYCYVRDFYYCVMNDSDFPKFSLKQPKNKRGTAK
jgi:CRISPR-associated protein Cas1